MRTQWSRLLSSMLVAVVGISLVTGCTDLGVGRKCVNPVDAGVTGVQLSSPALECPSRLCLLNQGQNGAPDRSVCTATCATVDDCVGAVQGDAMKGLCGTEGFVCAVATVAGPFCCKKICICKSDLIMGVNQDTNGAVMVPPSCQPNSGSSCANIGK